MIVYWVQMMERCFGREILASLVVEGGPETRSVLSRGGLVG